MAGVGVNGNLIPPKKGEIRNPNGKPKGTKHISTWIQELLNDEDFEANLIDSKRGMIEFKGAPLKAIILAARHQAINGDDKARDWLARYGWGTKLQLSNDPENPIMPQLTDEELNVRLSQLIASGATGTGKPALGEGSAPS